MQHGARYQARHDPGMDDEIPDFGDVEGLARLGRRALEAVDRMRLPEHERQVRIAEIEAAFDAAAGEGLPQLDLKPIDAKACPRYHRIEANGPSGAVLLCDWLSASSSFHPVLARRNVRPRRGD